MSDAKDPGNQQAREQDIDLDETDEAAVEDREGVNPRVVHEVIRRAGDEELDRPALSLLLSGFAGGIAISTSILGQSLIEGALPEGESRALLASVGYTLGFLIVVLGRLQLFTESTLSAVIPVVTHPGSANFLRLLRLWLLVLAANLAGTALIAAANVAGWLATPEQVGDMMALSRHLLERDGWATLRAGIPAGFLIAAVPWVMPAARGQEFWVVLAFTYFISLGGFAHVVAGSGEAWMLVFAGETSLGHALGGIMLPALIGNIVGGTGLFALLAHGQVREEL